MHVGIRWAPRKRGALLAAMSLIKHGWMQSGSHVRTHKVKAVQLATWRGLAAQTQTWVSVGSTEISVWFIVKQCMFWWVVSFKCVLGLIFRMLCRTCLIMAFRSLTLFSLGQMESYFSVSWFRWPEWCREWWWKWTKLRCVPGCVQPSETLPFSIYRSTDKPAKTADYQLCRPASTLWKWDL
jgi:hypothetical protein